MGEGNSHLLLQALHHLPYPERLWSGGICVCFPCYCFCEQRRKPASGVLNFCDGFEVMSLSFPRELLIPPGVPGHSDIHTPVFRCQLFPASHLDTVSDRICQSMRWIDVSIHVATWEVFFLNTSLTGSAGSSGRGELGCHESKYSLEVKPPVNNGSHKALTTTLVLPCKAGLGFSVSLLQNKT